MTSLQSSYSAVNHTSPHILIMEDEEVIAKGLEKHKLNPRLLKGIGVGAPGMIEMKSG